MAAATRYAATTSIDSMAALAAKLQEELRKDVRELVRGLPAGSRPNRRVRAV